MGRAANDLSSTPATSTGLLGSPTALGANLVVVKGGRSRQTRVLASEVEGRAYFERNEAHGHEQSCSVCKSRLGVVPEQ